MLDVRRIAACVTLGVAVAVVAATLSASGVAAPDAASPRVVNAYPIQATFSVEYEVDWGDGEDSADPCASWQTRDGRISVHAASNTRVAPFQGFITVHRPVRTVLYPRRMRNVPVWAQLSAVGAAEGTVRRYLTYEGGPRSCPGQQDYVPPSTDCRGRQALTSSLTRRPATLIAGFRPYVSTRDADSLDYNKHVISAPTASGTRLGEPFIGFRQALFLVVAPDEPLYTTCPTTRLAPEYPTFVAFDIGAGDWARLAALGARQTVTLGPRLTSGVCAAEEIPDVECTYRLRLKITIRRVR